MLMTEWKCSSLLLNTHVLDDADGARASFLHSWTSRLDTTPENRPQRHGKARLTPQHSPGQRSFSYDATVPEPKHPASNCHVLVHGWKYLVQREETVIGPAKHRMVPFSVLWPGAAVVEDEYSLKIGKTSEVREISLAPKLPQELTALI